LVKLRYFAGLNFEEVAEVMNISVPTAKRWWAYARAFDDVDRTSRLRAFGTGIQP
jgi:DNA-binding transcriptional regulator LsrR (DeoR family)